VTMKWLQKARPWLLSGLLLWVAPAEAGNSVAKVAGKILQVGVGARGVGMGEAQAAVVDDVYSLYWNPAGITRSRRPQVSLMHNSWFGEISSEYIGYVQPLADGGFGLAFNYVYFGEFEKYGIDSNNYPLPLDGKFTPFTLVTTFGYAQRFLPRLSVGANLKLVSESVDTYNSLTAALDLGLQYQRLLPGLDAGLTILNLGLPLQGYGLPLSIRAGAAYRLPFVINSKKDRFLAALDLNLPVPVDQPFYTNLGLEYWYDNTVAFRLGYKVSELNSLGSASGLTAGLGARVLDYTLDYAFASYGELGMTHRLSFTIGFGSAKKTARRASRRAATAKMRSVAAPQSQLGEKLVPTISGLSLRTPVSMEVESEEDARDRTRLKKVTFKFTRNTDQKIQMWDLKILDSQGRVLGRFTGSTLPPGITWDGKDKRGRPMKETAFASYRFQYTLEDGSTEKLEGRLLEKAEVKALQRPQQGSNRSKAEPILFEENSFDLTPEATRQLDDLGRVLKNRGHERIVVEGYTDSGPEKDQEFILAKRRADSAARYLSSAYKIPLTDMAVYARGSKNPVAPNSTESGRARNRRVEITIIYPR